MEGDHQIDLKSHFLKSFNTILIFLGLYLVVSIILELVYPTSAMQIAILDQVAYLVVVIANLFWQGKVWLRSSIVVLQVIHVVSMMLVI